MTTDTTTTKPKKKRPENLKVGGMRLLRGGHARTEQGLTSQQEAFCRARATGMTIAEAIAACGNAVKPQTAYGWERHSQQIRDRIKELSAMATENAILKTGLNREWVISRLMSVAERCMQAEPVLDKEGNNTGTYKFDSAGANTALKMLGDTMGLFKPAEKKPEDEYANLSDEDLARIVHELAAQTGLALGHNVIDVEAK